MHLRDEVINRSQSTRRHVPSLFLSILIFLSLELEILGFHLAAELHITVADGSLARGGWEQNQVEQ
jgi:hypothetical protein